MVDIKGYEGLYAACETGKIWAYSKRFSRGKRGPGLRTIRSRYLRTWLIGHGYEMVMLYKNKKPKKFLVHRLIAQTFIPNPQSLREVNHKNAKIRDNRPQNLEWVTSKQNKVHAWANGSYWHKGENHHLATLKKEDVRKIRKFCEEGVKTQREIAKQFGVCPMTISNIKLGRTWGHVT